MFQGWERADWLSLAGIAVPAFLAILSSFGALMKMGWRAVGHLGAIENLLLHVKVRVDELHEWKVVHAGEHVGIHGEIASHGKMLVQHGETLEQHAERLRVHAELIKMAADEDG